MDWSSWVSALSALASAVTAFALWRVAKATLSLQKSVEASKAPLVYIWFSGPIGLTSRSSLTFVNVGQTALPLRTLRIIGQDGQAVRLLLYQGDSTTLSLDAIRDMRVSNAPQVQTDVIFEPNVVYRTFSELQFIQLEVEVMYYDNSFEKVPMDLSNLGGKYILTGKGVMPSQN